jgi:hypothetical protein
VLKLTPLYAIVHSYHISEEVHRAANVICKLAEACLQSAYYFFRFPLRYVGANDWSIPGVMIRAPYEIFKRVFGLPTRGKSLKESLFNPGVRTVPKLASREEAQRHLKRIAMAAFAHTSNPDWIEPFGYKILDPRTLGITDENIQVKPLCFFDPDTGLKVVLAEKGSEIAIGFGAIGSDQSEVEDIDGAHKKMFRKQNVRAVWSLLGGDLSLLSKANQLIAKLLQNQYFQNKKITFSGQCLGGSLAQFFALKYEKEGYAYNSLPLGAGLQLQLDEEVVQRANNYVSHLYVQGDFLNNATTPGVIGTIFSRIGVKTPANFGRQYYIPAAYSKRADIHNYCLGSIMQYLGFDKRTKPKELPQDLLQ